MPRQWQGETSIDYFSMHTFIYIILIMCIINKHLKNDLRQKIHKANIVLKYSNAENNISDWEIEFI